MRLPLQIPSIAQPADSIANSIPDAREELEKLSTMSFDDLVTRFVNGVVELTIHIAMAVAVFYVGKFVIKKIYKIVESILTRRHADRSLSTFILSLIRIVLYFILIITVIGIVGLETSSFLALFASAGVAIGMALSGTLQNFAGGVLILLLKPYKIGDYIEASGYQGTVTEIQIFHTIINTYDNKSIIIPNGGLSTGSINNWSREDYRRLQWSVAISYGDNVDDARAEILKIFSEDDRIVKRYVEDDREMRRQALKLLATHDRATQESESAPEIIRRSWLWRMFHRAKVRKAMAQIDEQHSGPSPVAAVKVDRTPTVLVDELADSSVNLIARAWVHTTDYWGTYYHINEQIYKRLPGAGINFPFPQMDVHLDKNV